MRWMNLGGRIKSLRWRSEYVGWLVASILLFCISIPLFFITTSAVGLGLLPLSIALFFFALSFVSLYSLSYFTVRTLVPAKSVPDVLDSKLLMVSGIIGGVFLLLVIVVNIARHFFGVPLDALTPLSFPLLLLLAALAIITGYDIAQVNNTKDQVEPLLGPDDDSPFLYEIARGKSEWKAVSAGVLSIVIIASVALYTGSLIDGIATSGSIIAIILFILRFYPEEGE